jgi:hypothetical protein
MCLSLTQTSLREVKQLLSGIEPDMSARVWSLCASERVRSRRIFHTDVVVLELLKSVNCDQIPHRFSYFYSRHSFYLFLDVIVTYSKMFLYADSFSCFLCIQNYLIYESLPISCVTGGLVPSFWKHNGMVQVINNDNKVNPMWYTTSEEPGNLKRSCACYRGIDYALFSWISWQTIYARRGSIWFPYVGSIRRNCQQPTLPNANSEANWLVRFMSVKYSGGLLVRRLACDTWRRQLKEALSTFFIPSHLAGVLLEHRNIFTYVFAFFSTFGVMLMSK